MSSSDSDRFCTPDNSKLRASLAPGNDPTVSAQPVQLTWPRLSPTDKNSRTHGNAQPRYTVLSCITQQLLL
jgi:hypothetical protein